MGFRDELRQLKDAPPGRRFRDGHDRMKVDNRVLRVGLVVLGFVLMFAAAVTFWLPGPNFVLVLAGLALVGGQSETVARWMDHGEVAGRRWHEERWKPYPHKQRVKAIGVVAFWVGAAAAYWLSARQGWLPGWMPLV